MPNEQLAAINSPINHIYVPTHTHISMSELEPPSQEAIRVGALTKG
jgi:hypothetical protein